MRGARFRILDIDDKTAGIAPTAMDALSMALRLKNATILAWMDTPNGWEWVVVEQIVNGRQASLMTEE